MKKKKKKLTPDQKDRQKNMTIFVNGKQKRVKRPEEIDGMDADEFIRNNADPLWLHQNGMWEYIDMDDDEISKNDTEDTEDTENEDLLF